MKIEFNYVAPFNTTGYGVASVGYAEGLAAILGSGNKFPYSVIGNPDLDNPELRSKTNIIEMINVDSAPNKPNFIFWHFHDIEKYLGKWYNIGFSTFEADDFKPEEKHTILQLDAVGTASKWGAKILKDRFPDFQGNIFHVPHAFKVVPEDTIPGLKYNNPIPKWKELLGNRNIPDDAFVLSSCGKFEIRKGHMALLDILPELDKDILLCGFWFNPFIPDGYHFSELYTRGYEPVFTPSGLKLFRKGKAQIALMPPTPTRHELHGALSTAHSYISPSFAEGWDLPLFEMMGYGMHCIATGVAAQSDYVTSDNCTIIKTTNSDLEPAFDGQFFHGVGFWTRPKNDAIIEAVLRSMKLHEGSRAGSKVNQLRQNARNTVGEYSWSQSAKMILDVVRKANSKETSLSGT